MTFRAAVAIAAFGLVACSSPKSGTLGTRATPTPSTTSAPLGYSVAASRQEVRAGRTYLGPPDAARATPTHTAAQAIAAATALTGETAQPTVTYGLFTDLVFTTADGTKPYASTAVPAFLVTFENVPCAPSGGPPGAGGASAAAAGAYVCTDVVPVADSDLSVLVGMFQTGRPAG